MSKLIIEDLKMVKEYTIYQNKGSREAQPLGIWPKYLPGGGGGGRSGSLWKFV